MGIAVWFAAERIKPPSVESLLRGIIS